MMTLTQTPPQPVFDIVEEGSRHARSLRPGARSRDSAGGLRLRPEPRPRTVVIGVGYVGLVTAACLAATGARVTAVDVDAARIEGLQQGRIPIYEPGLDEVVAHAAAGAHLQFTNELAHGLEGADIVFIAVGTPPCPQTGQADLGALVAAAEAVAAAARGPLLVVTKSTVPVGTAAMLTQLFGHLRPELAIEVASNPEFLREGSAVGDFMQPDRIVCGVSSERARALLEALYRPLLDAGAPMLMTDPSTAELIKYAANSFLAAKISFINEMADLCEKLGADVKDVARGMGMDHRIGAAFLKPGPGYGGSCFPKDVQALLETSRASGVELSLVEAAASANARRRQAMAERVRTACGGSLAGRRVACLGVTFKAGTDDVRESPALSILPALQAGGAVVAAYDPKGMKHAAHQLQDIVWCDSALQALEDADVLLLLTEWDEFRQLPLRQAAMLMRRPVMVDLRNLIEPEVARAAGFAYHGLGRRSEPAPAL